MLNKDDIRNSPLRAGMMRSMGLPAERRVRKVRRAMWHLSDAVKDFFTLLFSIFSFAMVWLALNGIERWFR